MTARIEVKGINKSDRYKAHQRIKSIGGGHGTLRWKHAEQQAIKWIQDGTFAYFVIHGGREMAVIIAVSSSGQNYLKTAADGEQPDNLLRLPECP